MKNHSEEGGMYNATVGEPVRVDCLGPEPDLGWVLP